MVVFAGAAAAPDRSHGVNHVTRFQAASRCRHRLTGRAATLPGPNPFAFFEDGRTSCPVDRAVDAAASEQAAVRRVYNRVDLFPGDVSDLQCYLRHKDLKRLYEIGRDSGSVKAFTGGPTACAGLIFQLTS